MYRSESSYSSNGDKGGYGYHNIRNKTPANTGKNKTGNMMDYSEGIVQNQFLYSPVHELPDLSSFLTKDIEIFIEKKYMNWENLNIQKRRIWGTDSYTSNSDPVCMLYHSNLYSPDDPKWKGMEGVSLRCNVLKAKKTYEGSIRNGLESRKYNQTHQFPGHTLRPISLHITNIFSSTEQGLPLLQKLASKMAPMKKPVVEKINQQEIPPLPANHIIFNLNNEPAFAYNLQNICDKGEDHKHWLATRLKKQVLYLETLDGRRFEIYRPVDKNELQNIFKDPDNLRVAKVNDPMRLDSEQLQNESIPLDDEHIKILYQDLGWDKILWGNSEVQFGDLLVEDVVSFRFFPKKVISTSVISLIE